LRSVSTTGNAETDVHAGERGGEGGGRRGEGREEDDGLVELGTEDGSAEEGEGNTVDLDESLSFPSQSDSSGGLLLAESLD